MLEWETITDNSRYQNEQEALKLFGAELKQIYFNLITSDQVDAQSSLFSSYVINSVEDTSKESKVILDASYREMIQPRMDYCARVAASFIRKLSTNFRDAICSELYENPDLSSNARGVIIVLAPTIITLLGLPLAYAALAVPISVIISRIGIKTFCQDYEVQKQSKDFVKQRLEIHRKNLLFLEQEAARYSSETIPETLRLAIVQEESKINELEGEIQSLQRQ